MPLGMRASRSSRRRLRDASVILAAAALTFVTSVSAAPAAPPPPVTVRAVIWPNLVITVAPASFKRGTVLFTIKNRDSMAHVFEINGVKSKPIAPHKVVAMTVTFKKPSVYSYTLPDYLPSPEHLFVKVGGQVKVK